VGFLGVRAATVRERWRTRALTFDDTVNITLLPNGIVRGHGDRRDGKRAKHLIDCQITSCGKAPREIQTTDSAGIEFASHISGFVK
jgi:hypothetical protein